MLCVRSLSLFFCCCILWLLSTAASSAQSPDRFEHLIDARPSMTGRDNAAVWTSEQCRAIRQARNARELLEFFQETVAAGQLPPDSNPATQLAWVTWRPRGWRWEDLVDQNRIILAVEDGFLVAIRIARHGRVEMSLSESSGGGAASPAARHFAAMNEKHLSRIEPEAHQLYAYFAGPSRTIVRSRALATPVWADLARGSPGRR